MNDRYKYTFAINGQTHFMRAAIESLVLLETAFVESDWEEAGGFFKANPVLYKKPVPTAIAGVEIVGGVVVFVATCFGKKVFDEFYDRLWKRPVGGFVDALLEKLDIQEDKLLEFRDVIYFEDLDVAIVIRILTKASDLKSVNAMLLEAHRVSHRHLSAGGRTAPIHCYRVVNGRVDAPAFYLSMDHLESEDNVKLKTVRIFGAPSIVRD